MLLHLTYKAPCSWESEQTIPLSREPFPTHVQYDAPLGQNGQDMREFSGNIKSKTSTESFGYQPKH